MIRVHANSTITRSWTLGSTLQDASILDHTIQSAWEYPDQTQVSKHSLLASTRMGATMRATTPWALPPVTPLYRESTTGTPLLQSSEGSSVGASSSDDDNSNSMKTMMDGQYKRCYNQAPVL